MLTILHHHNRLRNASKKVRIKIPFVCWMTNEADVNFTYAADLIKSTAIRVFQLLLFIIGRAEVLL